ncbi:nuclear transport factor 2 family protein [Celeribacter litoreus]|uniref:nuclear transport factor 2 family protein n=1 Tax=Celeribacter litoreus TaxID=2876714 RepID=UPI001CCCA9C5|nr:nuclear transport factor 2 family protein [Celeribacter litoreus]MCA0042480.1 nuclear transport factor 2 family protein [Celeribacter litoreus]
MTDQDVLTAFYAAYNSHDAQAATDLYVEDGRHDEIAMGKSRTGHAALREGLEGFFGMLPDVEWTSKEVIRSADWLAVSYRMTGTFTPRAKEGAPSPSPKSVALDGLHLLKVVGGRIEITQDYWSKDAFLAQIG